MTFSRTTSSFITCTIFASLAPLASAAVQDHEFRIREVRVSAGLVGDTEDVEVHGRFDGESGSSSFDGLGKGVRASLGLFESFGTSNHGGVFLLGLSFAHQEHRGALGPRAYQVSSSNFVGANGTLEVSANVVDIHIGYALPISRHLHVELAPFVGIGSLAVSDKTLQADPDDETAPPTLQDADNGHGGSYHEFGLNAGLFYTWTNGVQLGFNAGYLIGKGNATVSYQVTDGDPQTADTPKRVSTEYQIDLQAPYGNIELGYRF